MEQEKKKRNDFFPFRFKNEATIKAIEQAIQTNEGVLPEQMDKYLEMAHARNTGPLLVELKHTLKKFWRDHTPMNLADLIGLVEFTLTDLKRDVLNGGDKVMEELKKRGL